jgi:hypothetical protein
VTARGRRGLLLAVVLLGGALAGNGLAGLAHTPPNGGCASNAAAMIEGADWSGSLDWWPLGTSCEYRSDRVVASARYAPATVELAAWIALATLLAAFAIDLLLRPRGEHPLAGPALVAAALPAPVFCAFLVFLFLDLEPLGIVVAIVAGAVVGAGVARWQPRCDLLPSV